jgi:hypothetical protein
VEKVETDISLICAASDVMTHSAQTSSIGDAALEPNIATKVTKRGKSISS